MKNWILFIATFSYLTGLSQDYFSEGNLAYQDERYTDAIASYSRLIDQGELGVNIFHNLGNAYYKNYELGKAIWAYESGLKIEPNNDNLKQNLGFVNSKTVDQIDTESSGIGKWMNDTLFGSIVNFWAIISVISALLVAMSLYLFFASKEKSKRNLSLIGGFGGMILLIASILLAASHKSQLTEQNQGVIIEQLVEIKVSPSEEALTSYELHEGAKVNLLKSEGSWQQIEVNGNQGWVQTSRIWGI